MEKLGKILLFILNIFINIFLISLVIFLLLWLLGGIKPEESIQKVGSWIEQTWDSFTGRVPSERMEKLSDKQRKKAYRHLYVQEPDKHNKNGRITQPYKYELE